MKEGRAGSGYCITLVHVRKAYAACDISFSTLGFIDKPENIIS